ncbi:hypothetical protein FA13DRAFT_1742251 [Coprinellus micaceus]|uniref:Uncharacterized protein n=1 Tax=Coprinellus micaceus TaxID=71717 RepID=A0A4Y7SHA6_COPMI|nr:hypothetical protein FA13DRAFT_1742251 [Coprinellus micaceus]
MDRFASLFRQICLYPAYALVAVFSHLLDGFFSVIGTYSTSLPICTGSTYHYLGLHSTWGQRPFQFNRPLNDPYSDVQ